MIRFSRSLVLLLAAVVLGGCAAAPVSNCELLTQVARDFSRQLRWRETDAALRLVQPAPDGVRAAWAEALLPIELVDCLVKELSCSPATEVADSVLSFSYLRSGSATLRTADVPVSWRFQPSSGWMVISPPPMLP